MTNKLLRTGSAKDVYQVIGNDGQTECLEFKFTDRVSVFDRGPIPTPFTGLGRVRCAIAGRIFQLMQKEGFQTHYISHDVPSATMRVYPLNIKQLRLTFGQDAIGWLYETELLFRYVVTQGVIDRVNADALDRALVERHLSGELEVGARFEPAFCEESTKFEDPDRYLSHEESAKLMQVTPVRLDIIHKTQVREVANFLRRFCRSVGYDVLDGKFEAGSLLRTAQFVLADTVSPDELRLVAEDGERCDKDLVRQWYEQNQSDWFERLKAAKEKHRNDKSQWPEYEAVPPSCIIDATVSRYRKFAKAIGAL